MTETSTVIARSDRDRTVKCTYKNLDYMGA